jgi:cytochrome c oxidase subunit 2
MFKNTFAFCDVAQNYQIGLQDPASSTVEGMIYFYDYITLFLIIIGVFVFWMLVQVFIRFNKESHEKSEIFTHSSLLEIIWTILPALILVLMAIPSFALLYSLDELINPEMTLKIVGHQWYWSYEYSDSFKSNVNNGGYGFDSYMIPESDLSPRGAFRLLETDHKVVLPVKTHIRLLVTAADVLHSWAVPSFGIKIDACPGRLSQGSLFIKREGFFYGQCSEICGINHGFMPIVVRSVQPEQYLSWLDVMYANN